jgi:hypothetical protein
MKVLDLLDKTIVKLDNLLGFAFYDSELIYIGGFADSSKKVG